MEDKAGKEKTVYFVLGLVVQILCCAVMTLVICWGFDFRWSWKASIAVWAVYFMIHGKDRK